MDDRTFVEAAFKRAGKPIKGVDVDEIVALKSARWKTIVDSELPLFEGIENFVEKMAQEFSLGIVSMAGWNEIKFVLDKSGMAKHFSDRQCVGCFKMQTRP